MGFPQEEKEAFFASLAPFHSLLLLLPLPIYVNHMPDLSVLGEKGRRGTHSFPWQVANTSVSLCVLLQ